MVVGDIIGQLDDGQSCRGGVWFSAPLSGGQQAVHQTLPNGPADPLPTGRLKACCTPGRPTGEDTAGQ